jgi:hypothetical protein
MAIPAAITLFISSEGRRGSRSGRRDSRLSSGTVSVPRAVVIVVVRRDVVGGLEIVKRSNCCSLKDVDCGGSAVRVVNVVEVGIVSQLVVVFSPQVGSPVPHDVSAPLSASFMTKSGSCAEEEAWPDGPRSPLPRRG